MKIKYLLILILIFSGFCSADSGSEWEPEVNNLLLSQKYEEAIFLLTNSSNKGDAKAQAVLGELYKKFEEYDKAKYWLYKSAEAGNQHGQFYLAGYLLQIVQTEASFNEALQWLEKSAVQGNERSKSLIAQINQLQNSSNLPKPIDGTYDTAEILKFSSDTILKSFENKPESKACYKVKSDFSNEVRKSSKLCSEKIIASYTKEIKDDDYNKVTAEFGYCVREDILKNTGVTHTELIECIKVANQK